MADAQPHPVGRFLSLDGLRGAAALSVVFSHAFWSNPAFSNAVELAHTGEADPITYLFTYTPLHILWIGQEAVIVFFVLSGFVLARPFVRPGRSYAPYYASRFIRLLLPSWAALLVAWLIALTSYPRAGHSASWLLDHQIGLDTTVGALKHFTLLTGVPTVLPPLWSLQNEVAFSLLLPVFVVVGRWAIRPWRIMLVMLGVLLCYGAGAYVDGRFIEFLPVFAIGTMLATNLGKVEEWAARGHRSAWVFWGSLVLVAAQWYPRGFSSSSGVAGLGQLVSVLGATGLVVAALTWSPLRRGLGESRVMRWLGTRSFSLYLIHFPIIMLAAFLSDGENLWLTLGVGVPSALIAAEALYRLVEVPSTRLTHRVRDAVRSRRSREAIVTRL